VGHFLSVHEGPHAISGRNSMPLEENMVLSIEPGHYKEGAFGMRIENLYVVKKSANFQGFMEFELLTMVPIETSLIDFELLSKDEIDWLKRHNQNTIESIQDQLTREEVEFLSINLTIKN
jgi:Xaa-Pro aminopeptidase